MKNKVLLYGTLTGLVVLLYFRFGRKKQVKSVSTSKIKSTIEPDFKTGGIKSPVKSDLYPTGGIKSSTIKPIYIQDIAIKPTALLIKPVKYIRDYGDTVDSGSIKLSRYIIEQGIIGDLDQMDVVR